MGLSAFNRVRELQAKEQAEAVKTKKNDNKSVAQKSKKGGANKE